MTPKVKFISKVFISQPMKDLSDMEILETKIRVKEKVEKLYGLNVEIVSAYVPDVPHVDKVALWYLGESFKKMSEADIVVFAKGWEDYRGCTLEYVAANSYGLQVVEESELDNDLVDSN